MDVTQEGKHKDLPWHRFNPLPFATNLSDCSSLGVSCRVEDLVTLVHFLKGSMDVRMCMVRVVYAREAVPVQGVGKPQSTPERGLPRVGGVVLPRYIVPLVSWSYMHQLVISSLPFSISLSPLLLPSSLPPFPTSPHTLLCTLSPFCAEVSTKYKRHQRQRKDGC